MFAMKDDDHELPNVLTECAGFDSLPLRRGCARVRSRESERRPARRHDAEVRSRLRRLPSDVRFVLPSLRVARGRRKKGTCQVHAPLRGLRGLLQTMRDVVRPPKRPHRACCGVLRQMLRGVCCRLREDSRRRTDGRLRQVLPHLRQAMSRDGEDAEVRLRRRSSRRCSRLRSCQSPRSPPTQSRLLTKWRTRKRRLRNERTSHSVRSFRRWPSSALPDADVPCRAERFVFSELAS